MDWGYGGVRSKCDCGRRKITRDRDEETNWEEEEREREEGQSVRVERRECCVCDTEWGELKTSTNARKRSKRGENRSLFLDASALDSYFSFYLLVFSIGLCSSLSFSRFFVSMFFNVFFLFERRGRFQQWRRRKKVVEKEFYLVSSSVAHIARVCLNAVIWTDAVLVFFSAVLSRWRGSQSACTLETL